MNTLCLDGIAYFLTLVLLAPSVIGLWNVARRNRFAFFQWIGSYRWQLLAVAYPSIWVLFVLPYLVPWDLGSAEWKFWLGTAARVWSPDMFPQFLGHGADPAVALSLADRYQFTFSAIVALLLNNAIYFAAVALAWRLVADRSKLMELAQAINTRDARAIAAIGTAIGNVNYLGDEEKAKLVDLINVAFNSGVEDWADRFLVKIVGPIEAARLLSQLAPTAQK